jgi:hypothetical protein
MVGNATATTLVCGAVHLVADILVVCNEARDTVTAYLGGGAFGMLLRLKAYDRKC